MDSSIHHLIHREQYTLTTNGTPYLWYVGWGVTEGFEGQDAGDADGDGWTGRLEYLWGSNPVGGKEWPRMTVEWEGGSNAVRVVLAGTVTGRVYTVEGTTDLRGGWSEWASAPGSNGVTVFTFPATNSAAFFRARARLP
jgi:hypothetical protein